MNEVQAVENNETVLIITWSEWVEMEKVKEIVHSLTLNKE
jgi:hypothetical protein